MGRVAVNRAAGGRREMLVFIGHFSPGVKGGGPIRSLTHTLSTTPPDVHATVVTRDRDLGDDVPYPGLSGRWQRHGPHRVFYLDARRPGHWMILLRSLRPIRFELLYVNSLWSPLFSIVPVVASRLRLVRADRVLVAPRGELSPGALALKGRKKRWALRLWGPFLRATGVWWHTSSPQETRELRAALPWADVRAEGTQITARERALEPPGPHSGPLRLVFLSRISPKKNLAGLLEALGRVTTAVDLDVYGPVEDDQYWADCLSLIRRAPAHVRANYRGLLSHEQVAATFHEYDAFCFPTLGENFGHVIAESLAASCPVICSDRTPWSEVLRDGGGTVLSALSSDVIAAAVEDWARLDPQDRHRRRAAAGDAYNRWRAGLQVINVFDQVRATPQQRT